MGGFGADRLEGDGGVDVASYADAGAGVTVSLLNPAANTGEAAKDSFEAVEALECSRFADHLIGDDAANRLSGGLGSDTFRGGDGNDLLTGGAGADRFVFGTVPDRESNADGFTDFAAGQDEIRLVNAVFGALEQGGLAEGAFRASRSGAAANPHHRLLYETDTGWLRFDVDGTGGGAAVAFARLRAGLALGADDFFVA